MVAWVSMVSEKLISKMGKARVVKTTDLYGARHHCFVLHNVEYSR